MLSSRCRRGLALVVLTALLLSALPHPARAQDEATSKDPTVALRLFNEGKALFAKGEIDAAATKFEGARAILTRAGDVANAAWMLSWLADCHERRGKLAEAIEAHEKALADVKAARGGRDHQDVLQMLSSLVVRLLRLRQYARADVHSESFLAMCRRVIKGDHRVLALALNTRAACLSNLGRYAEAFDLYDGALEMRRRLYLGDHPDVATSLGNTSHALTQLGRHEEALERELAALAMWMRICRGDHRAVAGRIANLAFRYWHLGRPAEALARHEEGLAMRRRLARGAPHRDVMRSLNNLAYCLAHLGRPWEALGHFEEALAQCRRLHEGAHPVTAAALGALGHCLATVGRHEDALEQYRLALAMCSAVHEGDHPDTARASSNLAWCLAHLDRLEEAAGHARRAIEMRKRLYPEGNAVIAYSLEALADVHTRAGAHEEAIAAAREALAVSRRSHLAEIHHPATVLAALLGRKKETLPEAAALLGEAIAEIESRRREATGLEEQDRAAYFGQLKRLGPYDAMVTVQLRLGRPDEALRYLEKGRARSLLDLLERSRFDPLEELTRRARQRGQKEVLEEIEETKTALDESEAAIVRLTHAVGVARSKVGVGLKRKRAEINALTASLAEARAQVKTALRRRARLVRHSLQAAAPSDPQDIQRMLDRSERALVYLVGTNASHVILVPPPGGEIRGYPLVWPDGAPVTDESIRPAVEAYVGGLLTQGRRARGLRIDDEEEGGEDAGSAAGGHRLWRALVPEAVWDEILKAKRVRLVPHASLHRLPFETLVVRPGEEPSATTYWLDTGPGIAYGPSGSAMLWCRERRDEQREGELAARVVALGDPVFARGPAAAPPPPPETGVTIVEVQPDSTAALAGLAPGDVIVGYDGSPMKTHKSLRRALFDATSEHEDGERDSDTATLEVWRAGAIRKFAVALGPLGTKVAKVPPPEAWKILKEGVVRRRWTAERSGGTRYDSLEPLPGTRREVESLRDTFAKVKTPAGGTFHVDVLLGEDATQTRLYARAPRARFLHLATHQLSDETDNAIYSRLALTLPTVATATDDGFLELLDLLERWRDRLSACEMVVLSACESQRGRLRRDEGVFAMPWGFHYAGCPTVVASLWRVDDASTADLMSAFYAGLAESRREGKLAAFVAARKSLRKKFPQPYFWAPFILIGDPR